MHILIIFLITLILVLFQGTFLYVPAVLAWIYSLSVFYKKNFIYGLAFLAGLGLDFLERALWVGLNPSFFLISVRAIFYLLDNFPNRFYLHCFFYLFLQGIYFWLNRLGFLNTLTFGGWWLFLTFYFFIRALRKEEKNQLNFDF